MDESLLSIIQCSRTNNTVWDEDLNAMKPRRFIPQHQSSRNLTSAQLFYLLVAFLVFSSTHRNRLLCLGQQGNSHHYRTEIQSQGEVMERSRQQSEVDDLSTCFEKMILSDLNNDARLDRIEYPTFVDYMSHGYYEGEISFDDLPLSFTLSFLNSACSSCTTDNQETCCVGGFLDIVGTDGNYSSVCDTLVNPVDCEVQQLYLEVACNEVLRAIEYSKSELPTVLPTVAPSIMQSSLPSVAPTAVPMALFSTSNPTTEEFSGDNVTLTMTCSMRNDFFVDAISIQTANRRGIAIRDALLEAAISLFTELVEQSNDDNSNVLFNGPLVLFPDSLELTLIDRVCYTLFDFPLIGASKCANAEINVVILFPTMNMDDKTFIHRSFEEDTSKSVSSTSTFRSSFFESISSSNDVGIVDVSSLQLPSDRLLVSESLEIPVEYLIAWNNTHGLTVETILAERGDIGKFMFELEEALQAVARETLKEVFFLEDGELEEKIIGISRDRRLDLNYEKGDVIVNTIVDTVCTDDIFGDEISCGNVESTIILTLSNEDAPIILKFYQAALLKKIIADGALREAILSHDSSSGIVEIADTAAPLPETIETAPFTRSIVGISMTAGVVVLGIVVGGIYNRRRARDTRASKSKLYNVLDFTATNNRAGGILSRVIDPTSDNMTKSNNRGLSQHTAPASDGDDNSVVSSEDSCSVGSSSRCGSSYWSSGESLYSVDTGDLSANNDATLGQIGLAASMLRQGFDPTMLHQNFDSTRTMQTNNLNRI